MSCTSHTPLHTHAEFPPPPTKPSPTFCYPCPIVSHLTRIAHSLAHIIPCFPHLGPSSCPPPATPSHMKTTPLIPHLPHPLLSPQRSLQPRQSPPSPQQKTHRPTTIPRLPHLSGWRGWPPGPQQLAQEARLLITAAAATTKALNLNPRTHAHRGTHT